MSNPSITADKTPWYQWDTGLTVTVSGGEMNECHFANRKQGTAYVQAVINGVARVPDELLQVAAQIKAYGYVSDGAGGQTYIEQTFEVIARNIPSDYTYTKTAQKTIRDAEEARDQAVQAAKDAKASELAADDSAVEASNSAQSAGESASAAATSASNAAKSAGDAAKSASDAKAAADKAVDDASALLKTYTDNAKTSADNAATSASSAADAASAASGSASAAEQSATDANNAKAEAEAAKNEAATSASNAASSATAAANSASDAAASVNAINVISPKTVPNPATSSANNEVAIGMGASTTGGYGIAIGQESHATIGSVAIGSGAVADGVPGHTSLAIGDAAAAHGQKSVAAGSGSIANNNNEFSIGIPKIGSGQEYTREITHVSEPSAPTSASTKKYTDDNDAKTLSEAKKYTDDNTSNALVGTVIGKLLHVEDAWPGKPLCLTIDGAYKQDGTPSPENPVPITVIENPVLWVTGRNLIDVHEGMPESDCNKEFDNVIKRIIKPGTYVKGITSNNYMQTVTISDAVFSDGSITFSSNASGYGVGVGVSLVPGETYECTFTSTNAKCAVVFYASDGTHLSYVETQFFTVPANAAYTVILIVPSSVNQPSSASNIFIKRKETDGTYSPYVGTSLPITLPAEHPYMAALPDGTHDEIEIDKDGNASLVARVGRDDNVREVYDVKAGKYYALLTTLPSFASSQAQNGSSTLCSAIPSLSNGYGVYRTWNSVYVRDTSVGTTEEIQAEINKASPLTVFAPIPETRYQLGKLDMPALPETISNVWTEAELTTNMSMTYKRDINVAFDNLVQAVVAAAAGE